MERFINGIHLKTVPCNFHKTESAVLFGGSVVRAYWLRNDHLCQGVFRLHVTIHFAAKTNKNARSDERAFSISQRSAPSAGAVVDLNAFLNHVFEQVADAAAIAPLIVVPTHHLEKPLVEFDT